MKFWLVLSCAVALAAAQTATSNYNVTWIGGNSLVNLANGLTTVGNMLASYNNTLNTIRAGAWPGVLNILGTVNITYAALNKTYGPTQPSLVSLVSYSAPYLNQSIFDGERYITSSIYQDIASLSMSLQSAISNLFMNFQMLTNIGYQQQGENCTGRIAANVSVIALKVAKYAVCIQNNMMIASTLVAPVVNGMITQAIDDMRLVLNLFNFCRSSPAAATECTDEYFNNIWTDHSMIQSTFYQISSFLSSMIQDAQSRDSFCGQLINQDIQDDTMNAQNSFSRCAYPQSS
ncbi:uncharacterized protein LOC129758122 [Uranotaenia lowii]|uniref:uncharacterized protein LOC129754464 n=1 Tax=Uranotaenia lowii TaxID=190385 RepID=UPI002479B63E|nr:uncharacterized protein LOC129754464 [Uranotaenia lowii]XP_055611546.1 uncharacterized protein LOC129758122 [Uranotaenia lowii]